MCDIGHLYKELPHCYSYYDDDDDNDDDDDDDDDYNHNYNKILKSDWLSTALILALIGQCNWTGRAIRRALKWLSFSLLAKKNLGISCVLV